MDCAHCLFLLPHFPPRLYLECPLIATVPRSGAYALPNAAAFLTCVLAGGDLWVEVTRDASDAPAGGDGGREDGEDEGGAARGVQRAGEPPHPLAPAAAARLLAPLALLRLEHLLVEAARPLVLLAAAARLAPHGAVVGEAAEALRHLRHLAERRHVEVRERVHDQLAR